MKAKTVRQTINTFIHVSENREEPIQTYWTSALHLQSSPKCMVKGLCSCSSGLATKSFWHAKLACQKSRALTTAIKKKEKTWKCKAENTGILTSFLKQTKCG